MSVRDLEPKTLYDRLVALAERTLTLIEHFYLESYQQRTPPPPDDLVAPNARLAWRLSKLLEAALEVVETSFHITPHGDLTSRCRRLEQAGWDRLFPALSGEGDRRPLDSGLADRLAEETQARLWHIRVVEAFTAVSGSYMRQCPSAEPFADTVLLLHHTHCHILGGNPAKRPRLGERRALIRIDQPIVVQERLEAYRRDRRAAARGRAHRRPAGAPGGPDCAERFGLCPSARRQPAHVVRQGAGVDPTGGNRFAVLVADPAAVDVG